MENNTIGYKVAALEVEQFATFEENLPADDVPVNVLTELGIEITEDQQVVMSTAFTFVESKSIFIKIKVKSYFAIDPDSWEALYRFSEVVLPEDFGRHILELSIATTRGILHTKTAGTLFSHFLLPTIEVSDLIEGDITLG